jgi:3-methyladenine DNA glycosylase Tag
MLILACYPKVTDEFKSFDEFIWSFVDGKPIKNSWLEIDQVPTTTSESDRMSKELKCRGFKFVGSTICYAFVLAVGMVMIMLQIASDMRLSVTTHNHTLNWTKKLACF